MKSADNKRPLKVFLCHASADKPAVWDLYKRLTADGVDVWLDKEKLLPGQDWELEIRKEVRETDLVIVCLSKQFNEAGFRQKEVRLALDVAMEKPDGEVFIIPAKLEECEVIESLKRWHWVDLFENNGYTKLTQTLRLCAERVNATFTKAYQDLFSVSKLKSTPLAGEVGTLNNLALTHQDVNSLETAMKFFLQALDVSKKLGDKQSESIVFSNLGVAYWRMGDFSKATECFEQSLMISRQLGDRKTEVLILSNLASTYESVGDLVRATELYKESSIINKGIENSSIEVEKFDRIAYMSVSSLVLGYISIFADFLYVYSSLPILVIPIMNITGIVLGYISLKNRVNKSAVLGLVISSGNILVVALFFIRYLNTS